MAPLLLLDLCVTLGWLNKKHRNHRCDMLSCCSWSKFVFLQQKPYVGNYYQSVNFTDSKFWGRGLRGEKKGTCLLDRASHMIV